MGSMEERLQKYRQEKIKKDLIKFNIPWNSMTNLFTCTSSDSFVQQEDEPLNNRRLNIHHHSSLQSSGEEDSELINNNEENENDDISKFHKFKKSSQCNDNKFNVTLKIFIGFLWLLGLYIFINIEFAMVYICISLLTFICLNTRTYKDENEISAYSVFNKNCAPIEGTLDASQIDNEIRGGFSGLL